MRPMTVRELRDHLAGCDDTDLVTVRPSGNTRRLYAYGASRQRETERHPWNLRLFVVEAS